MLRQHPIESLPSHAAASIVELLLGDVDLEAISRWRRPVSLRRLASVLSPNALADLLAFRSTCKRFHHFYTMAFEFRTDTLPLRITTSNLELLVANVEVETNDNLERPVPSHQSAPRSSQSGQADTLTLRSTRKMSNDVSKVAPGRQSFILKLPNEIISIILEHLGYNPRQIKDIDRRSSLSLESFSSTRLPVPIDPGESNNVCNFVRWEDSRLWK